MEEHSATPELEDSNADSSTQSLLGPKVRRRCYPQMSRFQSKGAVLVIVWAFLIIVTLYISIGVSQDGDIFGGQIAFVFLLFPGPLCSMIASYCFSRYRMILVGVWLMWAASVLSTAVLVFKDLFPLEQRYSVFVAEVAYMIGIGLAWMNNITFGLDQIPDASVSQIKAFISRLGWSTLCALTLSSVVYSSYHKCVQKESLRSLGLTIQLLLSTAFLTLVLSSNHLLKSWLIIEPRSRSPLSRVYSILKFAVRHKHPVRRSALAYCEDQRPSRLDLSKSKYGGPFSTEEVEDVKTCFRMSLVIAIIPTVLFPTVAIYGSLLIFLKADFLPLKGPDASCHHQLIRGGYLSVLLIILSPPVYELVIYPLFRRWIPGTLKGIGLTLIFPLIGALIPLITSAIWYAKHQSLQCMFVSNQAEQHPLHMSRYWIEMPMYFLAFFFALSFYVGFLEFICAQAPYNLRSHLLGMFYYTALASGGLGAFVYNAWSMEYEKLSPNSANCSVWFYLFLALVTILGCVLWCCVAKWYKKRERYEPDSAHVAIEEYYDQHFGPQRQ